MTQAAAVNNYNILNKALIPDTAVDRVDAAQFNMILDGKITDNSTQADASTDNTVAAEKVMTLGDIKNAIKEGNLSDKLADFREILIKATNEANVENSLNLTLARDVNEIIDQIKGAVEEASELTEAPATAEVQASGESDEETTTEIPLVFQQVLTLFDKLAENAPLVIQAVNNPVETVSSLIESGVVEQEVMESISKVVEDNTESAESDLSTDIELDRDMLKELNVESISAETDTESEGSFTQQQSPEEYGVKVMLNQNMAKVDFSNIQSQTAQAKPVEITPDKLIEQITKHMENLHNGSKVNIVLNPQALGKVDIQLINTKEGLSAQFTVTTNEARELIMKGLDGLKDTLLAHGVNVDNISVKVSEAERESYNPDWTEQEGSRGGNKENGHPNREEKEKGLFEKTIAKNLEEKKNGNV